MKRLILLSIFAVSLALVSACGGSSSDGGGGGGVSGGSIYTGPTNVVILDNTTVDNVSRAMSNLDSGESGMDDAMNAGFGAVEGALGSMGGSLAPGQSGAIQTESFPATTVNGADVSESGSGTATVSGSVSYDDGVDSPPGYLYLMFNMNMTFDLFSVGGDTMNGGMSFSAEMEDTTDDNGTNGTESMTATVNFDNLVVTGTENITMDGGVSMTESTTRDNDSTITDLSEVVFMNFDVNEGDNSSRFNIDLATANFDASCTGYTGTYGYCVDYVGTMSVCSTTIPGCIDATVDVTVGLSIGGQTPIDGTVVIAGADTNWIYVYDESTAGTANIYQSDDDVYDAGTDTFIGTSTDSFF